MTGTCAACAASTPAAAMPSWPPWPGTRPRCDCTGSPPGFHAVASLPDGVEEEKVTAEARRRAIGLYGMSAYRSTGATRPAQLVLGFGNLSENAIQQGIAAVGDLLRAPGARSSR